MNIRTGMQMGLVGLGLLAVVLAGTVPVFANPPEVIKITDTQVISSSTAKIKVRGQVKADPDHIVAWDFGDGSQGVFVPGVTTGALVSTPWQTHQYPRKLGAFVYKLTLVGASHHDGDYSTYRQDTREVVVTCVRIPVRTCVTQVRIPTPQLISFTSSANPPNCPAAGYLVAVTGTGFVQGTMIKIIGPNATIQSGADVISSTSLTFVMQPLSNPNNASFKFRAVQPDGQESNTLAMCMNASTSSADEVGSPQESTQALKAEQTTTSWQQATGLSVTNHAQALEFVAQEPGVAVAFFALSGQKVGEASSASNRASLSLPATIASGVYFYVATVNAHGQPQRVLGKAVVLRSGQIQTLQPQTRTAKSALGNRLAPR